MKSKMLWPTERAISLTMKNCIIDEIAVYDRKKKNDITGNDPHMLDHLT